MVGRKCQGSWRGVTDSASMCKGYSSAVPRQCRLCDQKVVGLVPSRSGRIFFGGTLENVFVQSQLFVTVISVSLSPQF